MKKVDDLSKIIEFVLIEKHLVNSLEHKNNSKLKLK
jgi:hypothetical protein